MSFKLEIKNGKSILNNIVCYEKVDKMLLLIKVLTHIIEEGIK